MLKSRTVIWISSWKLYFSPLLQPGLEFGWRCTAPLQRAGSQAPASAPPGRQEAWEAGWRGDEPRSRRICTKCRPNFWPDLDKKKRDGLHLSRPVVCTSWTALTLVHMPPSVVRFGAIRVSPVDEVWNTLTAVLNFGVLKRIQTPRSLLNFILGF